MSPPPSVKFRFWRRPVNGADEPVAFMGIAGNKLEMLFVAPEERGKGVGRLLLRHAVEARGVREVDVNEQNPQARGFYERLGFRVCGRSETDGQGCRTRSSICGCPPIPASLLLKRAVHLPRRQFRIRDGVDRPDPVEDLPPLPAAGDDARPCAFYSDAARRRSAARRFRRRSC